MNRAYRYDVVVAGGGSAGVAAALGAARAGAKTLLIERNPYLGGEATHANILSYCGFYTRGEKPNLVVGGVGVELLELLKKLGEDISPVKSLTGNNIIPIHPEAVKYGLDLMMENSSVDVLLHCHLARVYRQGEQISGILCMDDEGTLEIQADSFVDATGEANVAFLAGCDTVRGDEKGALQLATMAFRVAHVSPDAKINLEAIKEAIRKGRDAGIPFLVRDAGGMAWRQGEDIVTFFIPSHSHRDLSCEELTKAEMNARKQARAYVEAFRRFLPGLENAILIQTGPKIGIREGRRIVGKYVMTLAEVFGKNQIFDGIARCGWSPEIHKSIHTMDSYQKLPDHFSFSIPLDALRPKNCRNLWCGGRTISCDSVAYGAVRVMGCGFATGHGAGVAAALGAEKEDNLMAIRRELLHQKAIL